ncbi:MAG TPA: YigZ family protein [Erysipelotrichaceae bacterium]|nr:YigZ family protein [Erysipelotrichaceae bacterium]
MYRLSKTASYSLIVKKSEFISLLFTVNSEDEVRERIKQVRKDHPKARHVCHGVILHGNQPIERSNDDGEPSGTAGLPILEVLRKRNMENILAVVVRYFGGTLLGSGGLIRAYSQSVSLCLDQAELTEVKSVLKSVVSFPINFTDPLINLLKNTTILKKEFEEDVVLTLLSEDESWLEPCQTLCSGQFTVVSQSKVDIEIPIKK